MTDTPRGTPDTPGKAVPDPWGYYYLRYFVGAIVGAGLLVVLWVGDPEVLSSFQHTLPPAPHEWGHLAAVIAALGTAGLAYCYIASAPILLMHGFRFLLPRAERCWWLLRLVPVMATVLLILIAFVWNFGSCTPCSLRSARFGQLLFYGPFGLVVLLQLVVLASPCINLNAVRHRYGGLARRRASSDAWVGEYVESYRHLREHGNALLIILMEVILAAALYEADTTVRFITVAMIWILPAAFSWFLGTWLEFELVPGKTAPNPAEVSSPLGSPPQWLCHWIRSHCTDEKSGPGRADGT